MKKFITSLVILSVLAVAFVAVDFFFLHLFLNAPEEPETVQQPAAVTRSAPAPTTSTPSQTGSPEETPQSVEANLSELDAAIAQARESGESQEVTLVVSEEEANLQASKQLEHMEMPESLPLELNSARVDFQSGNTVIININATAQLFVEITLDIAVVSEVNIVGGEPSITITDISFAGSGLLPSSVKQDLKDYINTQAESLLQQVTSVDLGQGDDIQIEYRDIEVLDNTASITVICKPV